MAGPGRWLGPLLLALPLLLPSVGGAGSLEGLSKALFEDYDTPFHQRLASVPDTCASCAGGELQSGEDRQSCTQFYSRFQASRSLRIQVSFGYADDSSGTPYVFEKKSLGYHAAVDGAYADAFRRSLLAPCLGSLQACEFREESPGRFIKTVAAPPNGAPLHVEVLLDHSALTPLHKLNTGTRREEQRRKSAAARAAYLGALRSSDVILYIGHSRNGGGPDFSPPLLRKDGRVDYRGYYMKKRPGLSLMLQALRDRPEPPPLLGLYSCYSELQFGKRLSEASPGTGFILSGTDGTMELDNNSNAAFATIDSLLRFQCYSGFQQELDASSPQGRNVSVRGFLTRHQPVRAGAARYEVEDY